MKHIKFLAKENKSLKKSIKDFTKLLDDNNKALKAFYLDCHNTLMESDFYTRTILDYTKNNTLLISHLPIYANCIPLHYIGNNEQKNVTFTVINNQIKLVYKCSLDKSSNRHLITLPLHLFLPENRTLLQSTIDNYIAARQQKRLNVINKELELKTAVLEKQFLELNSMIR